MPSPEIEELAEVLVGHVRDAAVRSCDAVLAPHAKGPVATRWRDAGAQDHEALVKLVISDCVDRTVFQLLHAIDDGLLKLWFSASTGKLIDLSDEGYGELAGWYSMGGNDGWIKKYSKERCVDDFGHLAQFFTKPRSHEENEDRSKDET